jgi:PmbA protein
VSSPSGARFAGIADRILGGATAGGATEAEAFFAHGRELTVKAFGGDVESLTSAEAQGVGVRVFTDSRMGFAYTSDLTVLGLKRVVEQALDACRFNEPDEHNGLPELASLDGMPELVAPDFDVPSVEDRVAMALELDRITAAQSGDVTRTAGAVYSDERGRVELYNTRGLRAAYDATVAYAYVEAIAERGEEMQSGFSFTYGRSSSALDLQACAAEAADRAARLLGSSQVASRTTPVLFEPWAAAELIGTLASSISAEAVQKGRSLLAGKLGETVASPVVSVVDDGCRADGLASRPWDGEGVSTQRTVIVDRGVLRSYLHNTYTARRDGSARSTGNASRGSHKATPELAPSNLVLVPGDDSAAALMQRMGDGVLISDVHGLHTANPVTGEFSLGISGFLVENGQRAAPIREMTVAGTILGLLQSVEAVGSDLRFMVGGGFVGAPSLLVRDLPIAGA